MALLSPPHVAHPGKSSLRRPVVRALSAAILALGLADPAAIGASLLPIFLDGFECDFGRWSVAVGAGALRVDPSLVYLLDETGVLRTFDPRLVGTATDPFAILGTLDCPAGPTPVPGWLGGVGPYALTIDRLGFGWVLYSTGEIFRLALDDGASCSATTFVPQQGNQWLLFALAFVSEVAGSNAESIYVGGGSPDATPGGAFGQVNPTTLVIANIGTLTNAGKARPEFTGLDTGLLFGFFPGTGSMFVQGIDRATGGALGTAMPVPPPTEIQAWAFAHRRTKFYLFVTLPTPTGSNSTVRALDRLTGTYDGVLLQNLPFTVVAAASSTCATSGAE